MDYCYSCRRHLNGALSCPGCGTPVEQLATVPVEPAPVAGTPAAPPEPDFTGGRAARRRPPPRRARRRGRTRLLTGAGVGLVLVVCTAAALSSGTFASGPEADTGPSQAPIGDSTPQAGASSPTPRHKARPARPSASASTSGTPSGSPSATPSASKTPTRSASPSSRPTSPSASDSPSPTRPPSPSPSPSCKHVLWWCE